MPEKRRFFIFLLTIQEKKRTIEVREYSLMVKPQLPKLMPRVRFPLLAPMQKRTHKRPFLHWRLSTGIRRVQRIDFRPPNEAAAQCFPVCEANDGALAVKENLPRCVSICRYSLQPATPAPNIGAHFCYFFSHPTTEKTS